MENLSQEGGTGSSARTQVPSLGHRLSRRVQTNGGSCSEIVLSNQGGDERWRDSFQIDRELADCHIARQVLLVDSSEGTQKVA